jgi:hypothetical protein
MLMRIVDQAFAALETSAEEGVSEVTCQTVESADDSGKLRLTDKSVSHHVRKDAGDVRFLEMAMKALREVRDLFGIGAEAESKLKAAVPDGGLALEALLRNGAVRLATRWRKPVESGARPWRLAPKAETRKIRKGGGLMRPKRGKLLEATTSIPSGGQTNQNNAD